MTLLFSKRPNMRISKISIIVVSLCLILSLNSALAATSTSQPKAKTEASMTKKVAKKTVKKPVKKAIKKVIKKEVKKVIKDEDKKRIQKPESPTPAPTPATEPAASTPKTYDVTIQNFAFAPLELKVKVGDSVKFTQKDSVAHTVDTDPHPDHTQLPGFDSGSLAQGQSYTYTFLKAGTFTYHCSPHPSMKGKIIVEE